jgi:hypothetical protein
MSLGYRVFIGLDHQAISLFDSSGDIDNLFHPELSEREKQVATLEGWVLGVL